MKKMGSGTVIGREKKRTEQKGEETGREGEGAR